MRKFFLLLAVLTAAYSTTALAGTTVNEGADAEKLYAADKGKAQVLVQKNREFILRTPDGKEAPKPTTITVKAGEKFYIINEESSFIHNVYDTTDSSWVLKKQAPSGVAAISFDTPGRHELRCAIHPTMKIDVVIVN